MQATDIIRAILDLIDQVEISPEKEPTQEPETVVEPPASDELARFKQIAGILPTEPMGDIANAPAPKYADVDAVTTLAGGGLNGPKHPRDIRVKDVSAYPEYTAPESGEQKPSIHAQLIAILNGLK